MSVEMDAEEAVDSATVQESSGNARPAGCNNARGTESVATVQDGTKRCATV